MNAFFWWHFVVFAITAVIIGLIIVGALWVRRRNRPEARRPEDTPGS